LDKKKKVVIAVIISALLVIGIAFALIYKFVITAPLNEYSVSENMVVWSVSDTSGLYLMVPDDYSVTESNAGNVYDFKLYHKDDARIKFTTDYTDLDIANFSYNAIEEYKKITDGFKLNNEFEETLSETTTVHVYEFDYSLNTAEGVKTFSCLSAFAIGNGKAYVVTCTCDGGNYDKYKNDFIRTYKTMHIQPVNP